MEASRQETQTRRRSTALRLRCAVAVGVAPLAALATAAPLGVVGSASIPATVAHADPAPLDSDQVAPTDTTFDARSTPAAFRSATPSADLPGPALAAYQRAEAVINASATSCHLPWELLAAVGQVETDHGRRTPPPAKPTPDTDAGLYDGTAAHDVPVGPLQLTPQAWAAVGVDADGDGNRSAEDLDDAALGLAVLLCGTEEDLGTEAGQRAALSKHNDDTGYADLVIRLAADYTTPAALSALNVSTQMVAPRATEATNDKSPRGATLQAEAGSSFALPLDAEASARNGTTSPKPGTDKPEKPTDPETPPTEEPSDPPTDEPGDGPGEGEETCSPDDETTPPEEETPDDEATDEGTEQEPSDEGDASEGEESDAEGEETEPPCEDDDATPDPDASKEPASPKARKQAARDANQDS